MLGRFRAALARIEVAPPLLLAMAGVFYPLYWVVSNFVTGDKPSDFVFFFWPVATDAANGNLIAAYSRDLAGSFTYPPHAAFIFMPFAAVRPTVAYFLFMVLTGGLFVYAARKWVPANFPLSTIIVSPAALWNIYYGQVGFLFAALWLLAFNGRWFAVALLTFKPHLGGLAALSLKTPRAFILTCGSVAGLVLASVLMFGVEIWPAFINQLGSHSARNGSMVGWDLLMISPGYSFGLFGHVMFAILAGVLLLRRINVFTAATAAMLISPYALTYDLTVASLGFLVLVHFHWNEMPKWQVAIIFLGFLVPNIAQATSMVASPILLAALWVQTRYDDRQLHGRDGRLWGEEKIMQQLPPFPDDMPQPSQPGQPSEAPSETPPQGPDIDVPSPSSPGTEAPTTPISPIG